MSKIIPKTMMRAEVKADVYGGPKCDEVSTYFSAWAFGDMEDDDFTEDITIQLSSLPAGAVVTVTYPCCPNCQLPREDKFENIGRGRMKIVGHADNCECGFDWNNWIQEQYS